VCGEAVEERRKRNVEDRRQKTEDRRQKTEDRMKKTVRKYSLKDPQQELDDKEFWRHQSYEYKILVVESLRRAWSKLNPERREHGNIKGFRRILRVVKQA
jgi:hypothetical protein